MNTFDTAAPPRSRQKHLTDRRRVVVHLGAEDRATLAQLRDQAAQATGQRPSVGLVVSAALSALTKNRQWN